MQTVLLPNFYSHAVAILRNITCTHTKENIISQLKIPNHYKQHLGSLITYSADELAE
jgi:hypothetical protein